MRCSATASVRATIVALGVLMSASAAHAAPLTRGAGLNLRTPVAPELEVLPAAESLPTVSEVTPASAPVGGGTTVLIKGEHLLASGTTVDFGGEEASEVSGTEVQLQVTTPPLAAGEVTVSVTTAAGTGTWSGRFIYVPPPPVSVTYPTTGAVTSGSMQQVEGTAGAEPGDSKVTVTLFKGASLGTPDEEHVVEESAGRWSTGFTDVGPGTYTVDAVQYDAFGSLVISSPVTFTVDPSLQTSDAPPLASFAWLPSAPKTGEPVSLVSSSSDVHSPITGFAWSLAGNSVFQNGGPLITTSFSTPGAHVVKLRVTSADGLSSVASETITVASRPATLMQPFPVVRIVGSDGNFGVKIALLSVEAPAGAQISVKCKGRGCPVKRVRRLARASASGASTVKFRRFERELPPGVSLTVRVSAAGEIGKYTRFVVRRGKLPKRVDTCLEPAGVKPMPCPST